jgi:hypothetical protein
VTVTRDSRSQRRNNKALAWLSTAVSNNLRSIPENIEPVITDAEWASNRLPKALGLDHKRHRAFFDRLITWCVINQRAERKLIASIVRKKLSLKVKQVRGFIKVLLSLNSVDELFNARVRIAAGGSVDETRAQIRTLQVRLETLASDLKQAAKQLPRDVRRAKQQSEVLHHAVYVLHVYLRLHTGKGLSRKGLDRLGKSTGKSPADDQRREFAVWLFQIADRKLPERTILTAAEKAITEIMQTDEHLDRVHETIAWSVWDS